MLNFKIVNSVSLFILTVLIYLHFFYNIPFYYFLIILLCWFTLTVIGSFNIKWNYFLTALHSNKKCNFQNISITFDDGPHPEFTPKVLALLKKHNAKATFFCIGKNILKHPEVFNKIIEEGHAIGNHTFNHSTSFGFLNTKQVSNEIELTDKAIFKTIQKKALLFRPPFGVTNPSISKSLSKTKHKVIGWNVRSLDTKIKEETKIIHRITKKLTSGDIILLHDTSQKTVNVLEQLLLILNEQNYKSITVDKLLNIKAYE